MKYFWAVILLMGVAGVVLAMRATPSAVPVVPAQPAAARTAAPTVPATSVTQPPRTDSISPTLPQSGPLSSTAAPTATTNPPTPAAAPKVDVPATPAEPATTPATGETTKPTAPAGPKPATNIDAALDEMLGTTPQDGQRPKPTIETSADAAASSPNSPAPTTSEGSAKTDPAATNGMVTKPDGTLIFDGRFAVRGSGTLEDPYRVPWDLLVATNETYAPRKGLKKLPERIKFFDGKYVKLSGFIAFPITSANPKEMLVMLNQWDGCCIGVPPTPYDAVEVKLAKSPTPSQRSAMQGTLRGKLRIDPYEDSGWLLGIYYMEEGTLTTEE